MTVAAGLGCPGQRVKDAAALERVLLAAMSAPGPYVVEVPVPAGTTSAYDPPPTNQE